MRRVAASAEAVAGGSPVALLPGELPALAVPGLLDGGVASSVDQAAMRTVAIRAMAAGAGGLTSVGVAGLRHGDGATTVARALAVCLAESFGRRVVLVEANQRTACFRRVFGLPDGPGLADVLARRVSLGGAVQVAGEHARVLVLPASVRDVAVFGAAELRGLMGVLLDHADAAVVDLAPVLPYRDTSAVCAGVDGVALVVRAGSAAADGRRGVAMMREAGAAMLGAVLNRGPGPR